MGRGIWLKARAMNKMDKSQKLTGSTHRVIGTPLTSVIYPIILFIVLGLRLLILTSLKSFSNIYLEIIIPSIFYLTF